MSTKEMIYSSLMCACIAIGAFIQIPVGYTVITCQTLFVVLCAFLFPKKIAMTSILLYVGIGLLGIPIFAKGGGPSYVLQPTFGYIIGFVFAIAWMSFATKKNGRWIEDGLVALPGLLIIYFVGMLYFMMIQYFVYETSFNLMWVLWYLFILYLPTDILSCILAIFISRRFKKRILK